MSGWTKETDPTCYTFAIWKDKAGRDEELYWIHDTGKEISVEKSNKRADSNFPRRVVFRIASEVFWNRNYAIGEQRSIEDYSNGEVYYWAPV